MYLRGTSKYTYRRPELCACTGSLQKDDIISVIALGGTTTYLIGTHLSQLAVPVALMQHDSGLLAAMLHTQNAFSISSRYSSY